MIKISLIGNLIWLVLGGFISSISWMFLGLIWCITIIGIPFGLQAFKIGIYTFAPFGRKVVTVKSGVGGLLGNIIWLIFGGIELALYHLVVGLLLAITIIGIPFAKQHFELASLSLFPFGKEIR